MTLNELKDLCDKYIQQGHGSSDVRIDFDGDVHDVDLEFLDWDADLPINAIINLVTL